MKLTAWIMRFSKIFAAVTVLLLGIGIGLMLRVLTTHAQQPPQLHAATSASDCDIDMAIAPGKELLVTVSCLPRDDIRGIVSEFFAKDQADVKRKLDAVLDQSGDVTLTLTSKKRKPQ